MATNKVSIATAGSRVFHLDSAILMYRSHSGSDIYATVHQIERHRKGGPHLAAGVPATIEGCKAFARAIADRAAFAGFLSPRILYVGPRVTAWWRAPAPARVWFTEAEPAGDQTRVSIGKRTAVTPHPGLVFVLANGRWHVYAVKGAERPGPDTPLHMAPYFNVWKSGEICEGNVERPNRVTPETIARFERAFFDSRFTHPNTRRLVNFPGGAGAFWTELLDGRWKGFPERCLRPLKTMLATRLRKLEGPKNDG